MLGRRPLCASWRRPTFPPHAQNSVTPLLPPHRQPLALKLVARITYMHPGGGVSQLWLTSNSPHSPSWLCSFYPPTKQRISAHGLRYGAYTTVHHLYIAVFVLSPASSMCYTPCNENTGVGARIVIFVEPTRFRLPAVGWRLCVCPSFTRHQSPVTRHPSRSLPQTAASLSACGSRTATTRSLAAASPRTRSTPFAASAPFGSQIFAESRKFQTDETR